MTLITNKKIIKINKNINKFLYQYPNLKLITQYILKNLLKQINTIKPNNIIIT